MSIRDISLTSHQSIRTIIISSHEITANQHHSDVVLQSQDISLMRFKTMCSLGFVCFVGPLTVVWYSDCCSCFSVVFFTAICCSSYSFFSFWVFCGVDEVDNLIVSGVNVTICWVVACLIDWIATCLANWIAACLIVSCLAHS